MGIESDQLIYDYLSRVGDLAQQALPADRRMQLVAQLRNDIDRQLAGRDTPAAVRRVLGRIGAPDSVVEQAAGKPPQAPPAESAAARPRPLPEDEQELETGEPQWWRLPPPRRRDEDRPALPGLPGDQDGPDDWPGGPGPAAEAHPDGPGRSAERAWWRRTAPATTEPREPEPAPSSLRTLLRRRGSALAARRSRRFPRELLAAGLLVIGTVAGSWIAVFVGWALAYTSVRLSRSEAQWASFGIPLSVAAGAVVWLWGRGEGRWGEPLAGGRIGPELHGLLPVMVRVAAIGSAVFLLWRADRRSRLG